MSGLCAPLIARLYSNRISGVDAVPGIHLLIQPGIEHPVPVDFKNSQSRTRCILQSRKAIILFYIDQTFVPIFYW
jgi:hypothetical protein